MNLYKIQFNQIKFKFYIKLTLNMAEIKNDLTIITSTSFNLGSHQSIIFIFIFGPKNEIEIYAPNRNQLDLSNLKDCRKIIERF